MPAAAAERMSVSRVSAVGRGCGRPGRAEVGSAEGEPPGASVGWSAHRRDAGHRGRIHRPGTSPSAAVRRRRTVGTTAGRQPRRSPPFLRSSVIPTAGPRSSMGERYRLRSACGRDDRLILRSRRYLVPMGAHAPRRTSEHWRNRGRSSGRSGRRCRIVVSPGRFLQREGRMCPTPAPGGAPWTTPAMPPDALCAAPGCPKRADDCATGGRGGDARRVSRRA